MPDPGFGQNFLGLGVAFWPLIATDAGAVAGDGAPVELAVDAAGIAVVAGMAALRWFRVEHIIWYGGEIDLQARPDGVDALVLVDVEAGISADVSIGSVDIVSIDRNNPLIVRYKAIGFIIGNKAGESKFPFRPYFDSSKGYTIDVSKPGAIQVHDPFDKILKILGARLSRNNPFYVEVDLGFAVDLGVVSIDRRARAARSEPGRAAGDHRIRRKRHIPWRPTGQRIRPGRDRRAGQLGHRGRDGSHHHACERTHRGDAGGGADLRPKRRPRDGHPGLA